MTTHTRIKAALDKADEAFWTAVASCFPDAVEHPDFPAAHARGLRAAFSTAVLAWVDLNVPSAPPWQVGDKVRLTHSVDRFPHFVAPVGATGVVTQCDAMTLRVKMDVVIAGAEEWSNEVEWTSDEDDFPAALPLVPVEQAPLYVVLRDFAGRPEMCIVHHVAASAQDAREMANRAPMMRAARCWHATDVGGVAYVARFELLPAPSACAICGIWTGDCGCLAAVLDRSRYAAGGAKADGEDMRGIAARMRQLADELEQGVDYWAAEEAKHADRVADMTQLPARASR